MDIIQGKCSCGEPISIELNAVHGHAAVQTESVRSILTRTKSQR